MGHWNWTTAKVIVRNSKKEIFMRHGKNKSWALGRDGSFWAEEDEGYWVWNEDP